METHGRLSILVKSDRHFDFVEKLTEAAFQKKREVKIHIMGDGVALLWGNPFIRLTGIAQISICGDSVDKLHTDKITPIPESIQIVTPEQISRIIEWSDRSVVF